MTDLTWLETADRTSPWPQSRVVVAGLGASGFAAADALLELGARVVVADESESEAVADRARLLEELGAVVRLGSGATTGLERDADLVIVSPGWTPRAPLLAGAAAAGVPLWGDVELAWRLMFPDRVVPWLGVTGTNGKTTTTQMLASMLSAAGHRVATVGNIGRPVVEAINEGGYDVFAVELSSFQLHWTHSISLHAAAVLNVHPDHLEWYAHDTATDDDLMAEYAADKGRIYHLAQQACVYNVAEPLTRRLVEEADVVEGARAIGFTSGIPAVGMVGIVDDWLVDRAFIEQRADSALPLAAVTDVAPAAPHVVSNALAAAALARSFGVPSRAVSDGLRGMHVDGHRIQTVATAGGVRWVDDSKATNPHAAGASLGAFGSVVWIAGGQAKGTRFDDLVTTYAARLRAAVVLGVDRAVVADALRRHAPDVPLVVLDGGDRSVMAEAVREAARLARPGDTVLLAPGCASKDIWSGYDARGDDFAAAVAALPAHTGEGGEP